MSNPDFRGLAVDVSRRIFLQPIIEREEEIARVLEAMFKAGKESVAVTDIHALTDANDWAGYSMSDLVDVINSERRAFEKASAERDRLARELAIAKAAAAEHAAIRKSLKEACDQNGIKHDELRQRAVAAERERDEARRMWSDEANRNLRLQTLCREVKEAVSSWGVASDWKWLTDQIDAALAAPASPATATKVECKRCNMTGWYSVPGGLQAVCLHPGDNLDSHSKEPK